MLKRCNAQPSDNLLNGSFGLVMTYEKASAIRCSLDAFMNLECLQGDVLVHLVDCNATTCNKVMTHYH